MKQVIQNARNGKLTLQDVPIPEIGANEILVRTTTSLISSGTERMIVEFAKKSLPAKAKARPDLVKKILSKAKTDGISATLKAVMSRLDNPLPLGYSAAGVITKVGGGIEGSFRVGDRVAIAGAGIANHAEVNRVPRNLAAPIPEGLSDQEACYGTLAAIAMHAVRNLNASLGETVGILGVGLVGQIACQLLQISGVNTIALDYDSQRLNTAKSLASSIPINLQQPDITEKILSVTKGIGCDGIIIAAATPSNEPLEIAASIARDRARVCIVGNSGTEFPYSRFMQKELSIIISRSYGPGRYDADYEERDVKYPEGFVRWTETENLGECLRLMSSKLPVRLDVRGLTTHLFPISSAKEAYNLVIEKREPSMGVLLTYSDKTSKSYDWPTFPKVKIDNAKCTIGLIGAGNYTNNILLPELSKLPNTLHHTIVSKTGLSANHLKKKFHFKHASANISEIIDNPDITTILISTRHDSHSSLTSLALKANKFVLVEKPLGLNYEEIQTVVMARQKSNAFFQVNFNRRFAPFSITIKDHLRSKNGPLLMVFRVNAGTVPLNSWIQSPKEGGGRIIGEVCHFVDLARYFAGSPISSVMADAPRGKQDPCDDVTVNLRFKNGSLAVITYTSLGDKSYPKEHYEIYVDGSVVAMENFRTLKITSGGKSRSTRKIQDKGFKGLLSAFVSSANSGGNPPIDELELIETSRATIAVLASLNTGTRIDI